VAQAVNSVRSQVDVDVEHIVVDGASKDGSVGILQALRHPGMVFISEPDRGIYDALNKGVHLATGEVVGLMHSDDFFADERVLADVAKAFEDPSVDAVYGDLDYVAKDNPSKIVRKWKSGEYSRSRLRWGWMPPHPTLFLRRSVLERWGGYDATYRIAADYDSILRFFGRGEIRPAYVPRVLVKMRVGGESNRSLGRILQKSFEDYRALRSNGVGGFGALAWKNLSKVGQFR
jgi:glycosyltransferase